MVRKITGGIFNFRQEASGLSRIESRDGPTRTCCHHLPGWWSFCWDQWAAWRQLVTGAHPCRGDGTAESRQGVG